MRKILIIDDSMFNAKMLTDILIDEYDIAVAKSGEEGLKKIREYKPMLVLLDIVLPGISGMEVIKKLKADAELHAIPVIFITGCNDAALEEEGLKRGAVDYITKPFNRHIVLARVKTHIDLYSYRKRLEEMAMIDSLTGIFNRRALETKLDLYWQIARKNQLVISIIMIDIDYFKLYNDRYGHQAGDRTLKKVASILHESIYHYDESFVARYGGEEFCIILLNKDRDSAMNIGEKIRLDIEGLNIDHAGSKAAPYVTISMGGYSLIPKSEDDVARFFKKADELLYLSKKNGRNMLIWY